MSDIEERLRTERDEATKACHLAIKEMADMARDAGSWRGIAEGKDIVIRQLEGEIERLRADVARCEASLVAWVEAVGECNEDRNRLREALEDVLKVPRSDAAYGVIRCIARDALGESDA